MESPLEAFPLEAVSLEDIVHRPHEWVCENMESYAALIHSQLQAPSNRILLASLIMDLAETEALPFDWILLFCDAFAAANVSLVSSFLAKCFAVQPDALATYIMSSTAHLDSTALWRLVQCLPEEHCSLAVPLLEAASASYAEAPLAQKVLLVDSLGSAAAKAPQTFQIDASSWAGASPLQGASLKQDIAYFYLSRGDAAMDEDLLLALPELDALAAAQSDVAARDLEENLRKLTLSRADAIRSEDDAAHTVLGTVDDDDIDTEDAQDAGTPDASDRPATDPAAPRASGPQESTSSAPGEPTSSAPREPTSLLLDFYSANPALFDRKADVRRSKERRALRDATGMSDEQLEGWRIMLMRNPKKDVVLQDHADVMQRNVNHLVPAPEPKHRGAPPGRGKASPHVKRQRGHDKKMAKMRAM